MTYPVGTLLRAKKRWLTPSKVLLWAIHEETYTDFMVTRNNVVIYVGEWVARNNVIGTEEMRQHFLTPLGVFGRDTHLFEWDCFEPVNEWNVE